MYYSCFCLLALVLYVIINRKVLGTGWRKGATKVEKCYFLYCVDFIFFIITDLIWGLAYEWADVSVTYVDTVVYFVAMALSVVFWSYYSVAYLNNGNLFDKLLKYASWIMFIFVLSCLVMNFFSPILFSFDEEGNYITQPIRYLFFFAQILLFTLTSIYTLTSFFRSTGNVRRHNLTIAISGIVMAIFIYAQISHPLIPCYSVAALIASALIDSFVTEEEMQEKNRILENALTKAEKANAAKTVFLSNMSHEIRTPINAILGMNEIIRRDSNDEKIKSCAENIRRSGISLLSIISDILDFTKIETGNMELDMEEYQLKNLIGDVHNLVRFRAEDKGLELCFDIDENLPSAFRGDVLRVKQVLSNLMTNAVKYTEKGSITFSVSLLSVENGKANIRFRVEDTGIGIRADEIDKLFVAFERLDTDRTRTIEGTGLGLTISSRILGMMGSKFDVESTYGQGSAFTFELTQEIVDETPVGGGWLDLYSIESSSEHGEGIFFTAPSAKVLLVDDTSLNLEVICGLLKPTQIQIDTASSGAECIEKFDAGAYDMVFLDYMMPHMNGKETLDEMRKMFPEKVERTPIVSITASAVSGEKEKMLRAGFTDYIPKPVILPEIMKMLVRYLPHEKINTSRETVETPQAAPMEGIPKGLMEIPWIDVEEGVQFCGTADTYMMALGIFVNGIEEKAALLEGCLGKNDLNLFTINVHAIKSSSLTIGMEEFSNKAKELELAGKAGDLEQINKIFPDFIQEYRDMRAVLQCAIAD